VTCICSVGADVEARGFSQASRRSLRIGLQPQWQFLSTVAEAIFLGCLIARLNPCASTLAGAPGDLRHKPLSWRTTRPRSPLLSWQLRP